MRLNFQDLLEKLVTNGIVGTFKFLILKLLRIDEYLMQRIISRAKTIYQEADDLGLTGKERTEYIKKRVKEMIAQELKSPHKWVLKLVLGHVYFVIRHVKQFRQRK